MNINLQNYYNENSQYPVKSDGQAIQNAVNTTENTENTGEVNLKDLLVGDVFHGEILNIMNHDVDILLDNHQHVHAVMQQALEMNIGDKLLFQVKDKTDSQIVIRPVANNAVSMDLVNRSLMASGLSITDKNIAIVKELIGYEQPIDKQSIVNMIKLTGRYGSENIDKLIDMTKNGIEVNEKNLKMYDIYIQSKHQIASNINDIQRDIIQFIKDIPIQSREEGVQIPSEVLQRRLDEEVGLLLKLSEILEEQTAEKQTAEEHTVDAELSSEKGIADHVGIVLADSAGEEESALNVSKDIVKDEKPVLKEQTVQDNLILKDSVEQREDSEKTAPFENAGSLKDIADILKRMSESGMDREKLIKHLRSDRLSNKLSEILEKELYLSPDKLSKEKEHIKEHIDKVYEKLDKLSEMIRNHIEPAKNSSLTDSAANIRNNMNFMNELNHIESYIQLPVKFSEGKTNGDLYVYRKKHGKMHREDMLTAFLHLDMEYLGATDVNITMEKKNVITKFTLADEASMKLVSDHLDELIQRIKALGYQVTMTTEIMEQKEAKPFNPLQPITEQNEKAVAVKRYTLDIRT